jgi:hypothetical protein
LLKYEEFVERVTDDLLENVNNQLDLFKKERDNPAASAIPVKTEVFAPSQQMRTDNTMMKPQLAWWSQIDNSYYAFIPNLEIVSDKAYKAEGKYPIQVETEKSIQDRFKNPQKYKSLEFGGHKMQKDQKGLPHPYQRELEDYDQEVAEKEFPSQVAPRKYLGLDHTPFLFVET